MTTGCIVTSIRAAVSTRIRRTALTKRSLADDVGRRTLLKYETGFLLSHNTSTMFRLFTSLFFLHAFIIYLDDLSNKRNRPLRRLVIDASGELEERLLHL